MLGPCHRSSRIKRVAGLLIRKVGGDSSLSTGSD